MLARLVSACLFASLAFAPIRQTAVPNTLTVAERQAGWKLLFDGKTMKGWRAYDPAIDPAKGWTIEKGALKNAKNNGRPGSGGGDIVTVDQFTDFDLRFDWRISEGGNSGVKYFVHERIGAPGTPMWTGDDGRSAVGHEYQIIDDLHHADAAVGPDRQTGALYSLVPPNGAKSLKPVGEFNESRVLVQSNHVEHWLNGAKVVEYELNSPALLEAIANSKFKPVPGFGTKFKTRILLQDHGDEVWFRNLKLREIAAH